MKCLISMSLIISQTSPLPAHDATCVQKCQLHQAWSVCQVLPQPRESPHPPQPLPPGVSGRCVHLLPSGHSPGTPPALQAGLCQHSQEVLQGGFQKCQCKRYNHLEVERSSDQEN